MQNTLPSVGDLYSRSFNRFKQNFGYYIKNYILTVLIFIAIAALLALVFTILFFLVIQLDGTAQIATAIFFGICALLTAFIYSSLSYAVSIDIIMEHRTSVSEHLKYAWSRTSTMLQVTLWSNALIILSAILLVLPAIYLFIKYAFVKIAAMKSGATLRESFAQSKAVSDGRWWEIFGLLVAAYLPFFLIQILVQSGINKIANSALQFTASTIFVLFSIIYSIFIGLYTLELFEASRVQTTTPQIEQ